MRLRASMDGHSTVTRVGADELRFSIRWCFPRRPRRKGQHADRDTSAPYDVGERTARLSASVGCSLFFIGD